MRFRFSLRLGDAFGCGVAGLEIRLHACASAEDVAETCAIVVVGVVVAVVGVGSVYICVGCSVCVLPLATGATSFVGLLSRGGRSTAGKGGETSETGGHSGVDEDGGSVRTSGGGWVSGALSVGWAKGKEAGVVGGSVVGARLAEAGEEMFDADCSVGTAAVAFILGMLPALTLLPPCVICAHDVWLLLWGDHVLPFRPGGGRRIVTLELGAGLPVRLPPLFRRVLAAMS